MTNRVTSQMRRRPSERNTSPVVRHRLLFTCLLLHLALCLCYGVPCEAYAVEGQVLMEENVAVVLRQYVLQQGLWQPAQIEVAVRSFAPLSLPAGPATVRVLQPRKGVAPGVQSFLLEVVVGGRQVKTFWARAEVQIFDEVMVTSRPLAYLEAITTENVRLERREIGTLFTRPFTKIEEVADRQAARAIQVNQILTPTMVQLPQVVRPGSPVTLVYESARLRVEAAGQAVEGGKVGDVIRVKNLSSGQILEGQVTSSRIVIISP